MAIGRGDGDSESRMRVDAKDRTRGTIVCGVTDSDDGRSALELAATLSARLGLRLVLAHVADRPGPVRANGDESASAEQSGREGAAQLLARLAAEYGLDGTAERRGAVGDPAEMLARIAAEEAADLIVIGSQPRGRFRSGLRSSLVAELESETPVPVVVAPSGRNRRRNRSDALAAASEGR